MGGLHIKRFTLAFLLAAALFSCSRIEETAPSASLQTYTFSINADKQENEALSRALSLSDHYLDASWEVGDRLTVYNCTRGQLLNGWLAAQHSGNRNIAFTGSLTGVVAVGDILELRWKSADYKNQDGTLEYIAANCDYATARVSVSSMSGNVIRVDEKATLSAHQAIVRLALKHPDGSAFNAGLMSFTLNNEVHWGPAGTRVSPGDGLDNENLDDSGLSLYLTGLPNLYAANGGTGVVFLAIPGGQSRTVNVTATDATSHDSYTKTNNSINLTNGKYYEISMKLVAPEDNPVTAPAGWKSHIFDSDLFYEYTDSTSGVVSYYLKSEAIGWDNSQTLYFKTNEFTNDERFLCALVSYNEWGGATQQRKGLIIDLATRKKYLFPATNACYPYLDPVTDQLYYCKGNSDKTEAVFYRIDLLRNPEYAHELARFPASIIPVGATRPIKRMLNHITLTTDKTKVMIDPRMMDEYYWGLLDLYTGEWDQWGHSTEYNFTHAAMNPVHDDEALLAIDSWDAVDGTHHSMPYENDGKFDGAGTYMRMQYVKKNYTETIEPSADNYASHEGWTVDGDNVYWCSRGVHVRNIRTGAYTYVWQKQSGYSASHCHPNADLKYWTFDDNNGSGDWYGYRGCRWRVHFFNPQTNKRIFIYRVRPAITDKSHPSEIHPDPHPHFVCNDKYIVCTVSGGTDTPRFNLHWSITPVAQLIQKTAN